DPQQLREPSPLWSEEENDLRSYRWQAPEVDESLQAFVEGLDGAERRTRNWLLKTRPIAQRGVGVGMGASSLQPWFPHVLTAPRERSLPRASEGPGHFAGGSYAKYAELLEEWQMGRPHDVCIGGRWQESYAELHSQMLALEREPKLLEYACIRGHHPCGGLADRLLGITSLFLYSILTDRAFSISTEGTPFDLVFDSAGLVDWSQRFRPDSTSPHALYDNKTLERTKTGFHDMWAEDLDPFFSKFAENEHEWTRFETFNRGAVFRAFRLPEVAPKLADLDMRMSTAYSCLLNQLLRPKPTSLDFITNYTSVFSLPSTFSVGIQIRTGDESLVSGDTDLMNTVERHSQFFECAEQVASTYAIPSQKIVYYLVSDSAHLREDALRAFPDGKVVLSGFHPQHLELALTDTEEGMDLDGIRASLDGMMETIAENWIFAGTDFQLLTWQSGFGKIPTWLRGRPGSTIAL
ncbi:hypothetical protein BCR35DRAFT_247179, partial [Leucosporidium creatinivorum]